MAEQLDIPHVGEILQHEFMKPLGLSNRRLAKDLGVDTMTISRLVNGKVALSINLARRLGAYFEGSSAEYWLRLNMACELHRARLADDRSIEKEIESKQSA